MKSISIRNLISFFLHPFSLFLLPISFLLLTSSPLYSQPSETDRFSPSSMKEILYGVAYYYEYMPYERLEEDARMMQECGINMVRICESTWGYHERQDGEFHFDYVQRILDVMHKHGIKVIVGTPTYAIPTWLARKHPEILAVRKEGRARYGSRQNMDISHPVYRFYAGRMIRKLMEQTHWHPAVIGFQVDNETKHYDTAGQPEQ